MAKRIVFTGRDETPCGYPVPNGIKPEAAGRFAQAKIAAISVPSARDGSGIGIYIG